MNIYYAHSISLYGTPQENRDIEVLAALGFQIVNPNAPEHDAGYRAHGMDYFEQVLDTCDALAFRANPGGSINAGVLKEIYWMRERRKPVFELPTWMGRQLLSVEDTREFLREIGQR